MSYKKVDLYYFTGTGNALTGARWFQSMAESRNIPVTLQAIDRDYRPKTDRSVRDTLIGFFYPTHGFNAAPSMLKFLWKFPRGNNPVFFINTRAGSSIFRLALPGISGSAQFLPMLILLAKGYRIRGGLPLDMPSNWISVHPAYTDSMINFIIHVCHGRMEQFFEKIFSGKRVLIRVLFLDMIVDVPLLPITIAYYFFGRFFLAKTFIHTHECDGCNLCFDNCPVAAIHMVNDRPFWQHNCESCMRCISYCPRKAIQSSHLIFAGGMFIAFYPVIQFFSSWWFPTLPPMNEWLAFLINNLLALGAVYALYPVIQRGLRYPVIGYIFKYTSLTAYWRRYRAPGVKAAWFKKAMRR